MTYNVFSGTLNPTHFTSLGPELYAVSSQSSLADMVIMQVMCCHDDCLERNSCQNCSHLYLCATSVHNNVNAHDC